MGSALEIRVSQVVRTIFPPPQSTNSIFKKLGSAAHSAISQYFRTIAAIKEAPIDSKYKIKQLELATRLAINSNFQETEKEYQAEMRECVECYLTQHLKKLIVLGRRIGDASYDYLFPLAVERPFYRKCAFKVDGKTIWLKGKVDILWLSREYGGVLIEEIKATKWDDRFFQDKHALQAGLYYYLVNLEPGLKPVKAVKVSYLPMLDSKEVQITDNLLEKVVNSISITAQKSISN